MSSTTPNVVYRSRKRRALRWLVITLVGSFLLVTGWNFLRREQYRLDGNRELAKAVAEAEQTDPDWTWERLNAARTKPPAGKNGAELIPRVRAQLPEEWVRDTKPVRWEPVAPPAPPNVRYPAPVLAEARQNLARAAGAVQTARDLKDFPNGHRDINLAPDVLNTRLPDMPFTRTVALLLRWDAALAVEDGDAARATDDAVAALNASRSIGDEPFLISQLVRIAARTIATHALERVIAQAELTEEQLARVQAAWAADADEPLLLYGLRGERAAYDTLFRNLADGTVQPGAVAGGREPEVSWFERSGWWHWRVRLISERAYYVRWTTRAVEAARRPAHEQGPLLAALALPANSDMKIAPLLLPAAGKVAGAWHRGMGEARCAVVGVACERFRQKHKRWPEALTELVPAFLPDVPLDPFDGQPLRFAQSNDGVTVYSVGRKPPDQSGQSGAQPTVPHGLPEGVEIGFRLWNPDQRRLPPLPEPDLAPRREPGEPP